MKFRLVANAVLEAKDTAEAIKKLSQHFAKLAKDQTAKPLTFSDGEVRLEVLK